MSLALHESALLWPYQEISGGRDSGIVTLPELAEESKFCGQLLPLRIRLQGAELP
ncbi:hypothetical protein [Desulforamulus putei]|uniref:hypothetical protein n=1 Tax=Desulforamulus putei TaxID=74701 RepID=UPI00135663C9|nr:hypothetical protein [Desulforamulus putei]